MNKLEFTKHIAAKLDMPMSATVPIVNAIFDAAGDLLASGHEIMISGFGKFYVRERREHQSFDPRTGQPITVPAVKIPVLKPGRGLREKLNGVR